MSYMMSKPAWFGRVGQSTIISPAAVIEIGDWWDAWRLLWMAVGVANHQGATAHWTPR